MDTVTITIQEYQKLKEAEQKLEALRSQGIIKGDGRKFDSSAFGVWKRRFDKVSSVAYVNRIRKTWR